MKKVLVILGMFFCASSTYAAQRYRTIHNPFTGTQDYVVDIASTSVGALVDVSTIGVTLGQCLQWNGAKFVPAACISSATLPSGSTNYIQNVNTLQNGATFYVSSGTVKGTLTARTSASNVTPLVVSGIPGQTADLQTWISTNGVNASMAKDTLLGLNIQNVLGNLRIGPAQDSTDYAGIWFGKTSWSTGNYSFLGSSVYTAFNTTFQMAFNYNNSVRMLIGSNEVSIYGGADLNVLNSAADAYSFRSTPNSSSVQNTAYAINPGATALVVQGASSQTGNLQKWQNSSSADLSYVTAAGAFSIRPRTKSQLSTDVPEAANLIYTCSDCTTDGLVISTGTAAGSFARVSSKTTPIQ